MNRYVPATSDYENDPPPVVSPARRRPNRAERRADAVKARRRAKRTAKREATHPYVGLLPGTRFVDTSFMAKR